MLYKCNFLFDLIYGLLFHFLAQFENFYRLPLEMLQETSVYFSVAAKKLD